MLVKFGEKSPRLSPKTLMAENATAIGDVAAEENVSLWYGAVLRADQAPIVVGQGSNVQDNAVVHVSPGFPVTIGKNVTVGHGAIVHGATVEDECIIGMGAILLNGCVIGKGSLVAAGALVTQGKIIPPGSLVMGSPAKVARELTAEELAGGLASAKTYLELAQGQLPPADAGNNG